MTKGGDGTQQSTTMRDTQAPKCKVMMSTTVRGVEVEECGMACWFVKGVRREEDGTQVEDAPLRCGFSCKIIPS